MPPRGPKESAFGFLSLMLWVPALLMIVPVLLWVPGWAGGQPPNGCYFASNFILYVECKGTIADRFFGKALSFAVNWTIGMPVMAMFFPPLLLVWLPSIYFAIRFLTSELKRPEGRPDNPRRSRPL